MKNRVAPKKTLGAACYQAKTMSEEEEKKLEATNICGEWKYGYTNVSSSLWLTESPIDYFSVQFHRLAIPDQVSSWNKELLLYYPPIADPLGHQALADLGGKVGKKFLNPDGRKGIAGQGILKKLGENKLDIPIILRYRNGTTQILISAKRDNGEIEGPLPMFYRKPKKTKELLEWRESSAGEYFYSLLDPQNTTRCSMEALTKIFTPGSKVRDRRFTQSMRIAFYRCCLFCWRLVRRSSSNERDALLQGLETGLGEVLPPPPSMACENQATKWSKEEKEETAKNVFEKLLIALLKPSEFTFKNLVVGAKCGTSERQETILLMKVKRTNKKVEKLLSGYSKSNERRNVYCSWIGILEGEFPEKTLDAACYETEAISEEKRLFLSQDENLLAGMDICDEWNYPNTPLYRLPIPEQVSSWKKEMLFYYPPTANLPGSQTVAGTGKKASKKFLNPGGRKGLAGQGIFKKLGENKMDIPVILSPFQTKILIIKPSVCSGAQYLSCKYLNLKCCRFHNGTRQVLIATNSGNRVLEGPLPMFYRKPKNSTELHEWKEPSAYEYFYSLLDTHNETRCSKEKLLKTIKRGRKVYKGYLSYPYETDNAWVSAAIYLVKVSNESCFNHLNLNATENYFGYQWKTYDNSTLRTVQDVVSTFFNEKDSKKITAGSYRNLGKYLFFFMTATAIACVAFAEMKINAYWILPLLFVLLAARKDSSADDRSSSEEKDDLMEDLARNFEDIIPSRPRPACEKQSTEWNQEKKEKAARNVFNTLLLALEHSSEFTFKNLIAGAKCGTPERPQAILHMKVKRTVTVNCGLSSFSPFCKSNEQRNVYCTWIGILKNEVHEKTLGAVCYQSRTISAKEEKKLEATNICGEWKYAYTNLHRLPIPDQVSSWNADLLLYYPPTADLPGHQALAELGEKVPKKFLNPDGRKGIVGQGLLKQWGQNKMEIPIILRYHKGMRQVLVAVHRDKGELEGPLPMFYRKPRKGKLLREWNEPSADEYFYSLLDPRNKTRCSKEDFLKIMKPKSKIYEGDLPHPYETDNAWVNVVIYTVNASEESCLHYLNPRVKENHLHFQWKTYNDSTLQSVRNIVNTFYKGSRQILIAAHGDKGEMAGPLPAFYRKPTNSSVLREWNEPSADEYFYSLVEPRNKARCSKEKFLKTMKPKSKIFKGHIPHPYETDNAWVNAAIYMDSSSDDSSSSEEKDDLVGDLESNFEDIFPSRPSTACDKQSTKWSQEKKEKAAKNVFNSLLVALEHPSEFTFKKLVVGANCETSGRQETILLMKVKRTVTTSCALSFLNPFCKSSEKRTVYCSWIGNLKNEVHNKTLGAACYQARTISEEDEKKLEGMDICSEWKYGNTNLHRLSIPDQLSSWNTDFLLYYPPTADLPGHQTLAELGEKAAKKFSNPEGRKGLAGQGLLKKWGKNEMEIPIILRYYKGSRQILIAAHGDKGEMAGPLPAFYRKPTNSSVLREWNEPSADEYFYSLVEPRNKARCSKEKFLKTMKPKSKIFKGHIPHPYETDNAWVNAAIYMVTPSLDSCFNDLNLSGKENFLHYQWKAYNDSTLRSVQNIVNTFFNKKESRKITAASYRTVGNYLFYFTTATAVICVALGVAMPHTYALIIPAAIIVLAGILVTIYERRWDFIRSKLNVC
ncbi:hypothetical protein M513_11843 [Trichuris suis]|uniref:Uncharacterized protein n=1 Tax=Trichuris suis TaxID=68888 RepID=A0A085LQP4_9BILA|nr:hypothetical protein M513_11843 [Trichuris suis]